MYKECQKESRAAEVFAALKMKKMTAAAAESCTGGLVSKKITDLAGVSEVFLGGVVSYANSVKTEVLGVSAEDLERLGAVSETVAAEMCLGVRRALGADVGVSTTGIAGPGGGSDEKPVGTVCFGVCVGENVKTFTKHFGKELSRAEIRERASEYALSIVLDALTSPGFFASESSGGAI